MTHDSYIMQLRELVGTRPLIVPGARALIFDQNKHVLLQKRSDNLLWGLPAGSMEIGDSIETAMEREVKEETGLTVITSRVMGIYTDPKYSYTYPNGDQIQIFAVAFIVDSWQGQLCDDDPETLELKFFACDSLPENMHPPHRDCIGDYLSFDGNVFVK